MVFPCPTWDYATGDTSVAARPSATLAAVNRLRAFWRSILAEEDSGVRLGRILGLVFIVAGVLVIGKAWDGAASQNSIPAQIPYLLSGGFMGLALVVTGGLLLALAGLPAEREELSQRLDEVSRLLGRNLSRLQISTDGAEQSGERVIAGTTVYHVPGCKILKGKPGLATVTLEQAVAEGLAPCRSCNPPPPPGRGEEADEASTEVDHDTFKPQAAEPVTAESGTPAR